MIESKLPAFFKHKKANNLCRIGGDNDGGYVVCKADIEGSNFLLSFGLDTNWKFEKDFVAINDVPIQIYDASTNFKLFMRQFILAFFRLENPLRLLKRFLKYFSYKRFFNERYRHIKKFVGLDSGGVNISMRQVLSEIKHDNIFVKMDVEGSEYRCLDEIIEFQDKITGVVIEFHDVDLNIKRIEKFIEKFNLNLIHVHANNHSPITGNGLPLALEITFSRFCNPSDKQCQYPHPLDQPNKTTVEEILIGFVD